MEKQGEAACRRSDLAAAERPSACMSRPSSRARGQFIYMHIYTYLWQHILNVNIIHVY